MTAATVERLIVDSHTDCIVGAYDQPRLITPSACQIAITGACVTPWALQLAMAHLSDMCRWSVQNQMNPSTTAHVCEQQTRPKLGDHKIRHTD